MQAVLYTHQLEPITVLTIKPWLWRRLEMGDAIQIMVPFEVSWDQLHTLEDMAEMTTTVVVVRGELIQRGRHRTLMLFTDQEEHALKLQADFLPGQRREVQGRERKARRAGFADGFLTALDALGKA